jgi:hypothetical protein
MSGPTVAQIVATHIDQLRVLTSHRELAAWAEEHDLMTQARFPRFKKALAENGIDYEAIRTGVRSAEKAAATHQITLYSDAKARTLRYGICDQDGAPVWHGRDFDEITEQSAAEMAAAKKAVWLAGKVRETRGLAAGMLRLILIVDAQWLCYANGDSGGGKAAALRSAAAKAGVVLEVRWISGKSNPADEYTVCTGFLKWQDGIGAISVAQIDSAA